MPRQMQMPVSGPAADSAAGPGAADFLPLSRAEMEARGWDALDVLLVTGDAYVDHPAFGAALLGRWLEAHGLRVGIVAQPRWDTPTDVARLGRPRLFAGVTAGALDSLLAHYTAFRKRRRDDAYTPGGRAGARPNRAVIVYSGLLRQAFPGLPIVLGGIEASMRRAAHYDFWDDNLRRSVLLDSKADVLVYGMGERAALEIARRLQSDPRTARRPDSAAARELLRGIPGTAWWHGAAARPDAAAAQPLPSYEDIQADPRRLMAATLMIEQQALRHSPALCQSCEGRTVLFAPPPPPLTTAEMDALYALPFQRRPHPAYREPIPAAEMIRFSITSHRGCAGGCSFCALALHQGRQVQSRSAASILAEAAALTRDPAWRGSVTDVGGPTANMWGAVCAGRWETCRRASCLFPELCRRFRLEQTQAIRLLRNLAALPGVKHVRSASGVRHDLALGSVEYVRALVAEFVGGQLKLAPEHSAPRVLRLMRKPDFAVFERFLNLFETECRRSGRELYVVPYLISAFPGCTDEDMRRLAAWLGRRGWSPQQVQCFIPTPGTVASAMFYGGIAEDGAPIFVARSDAARLRQHRLLLNAVKRTGSRRHEQPRPAVAD